MGAMLMQCLSVFLCENRQVLEVVHWCIDQRMTYWAETPLQVSDSTVGQLSGAALLCEWQLCSTTDQPLVCRMGRYHHAR